MGGWEEKGCQIEDAREQLQADRFGVAVGNAAAQGLEGREKAAGIQSKAVPAQRKGQAVKE